MRSFRQLSNGTKTAEEVKAGWSGGVRDYRTGIRYAEDETGRGSLHLASKHQVAGGIASKVVIVPNFQPGGLLACFRSAM